MPQTSGSGHASGDVYDESELLQSEIFDLKHFDDFIPHQDAFVERGYAWVNLREFGWKFKVEPFYDMIPLPERHRPEHPLLQAKACWITLMKLYENTPIWALWYSTWSWYLWSTRLGACKVCQFPMFASTAATNMCGHTFHDHCLLNKAKASENANCPLECGPIADWHWRLRISKIGWRC